MSVFLVQTAAQTVCFYETTAQNPEEQSKGVNAAWSYDVVGNIIILQTAECTFSSSFIARDRNEVMLEYTLLDLTVNIFPLD